METLIAQFTMPGCQSLNESAKGLLWSGKIFQTLPLRRAEQAWGGVVPSHVVFIAQIQGVAIFITREWEITLRSRRLLDCVQGMCAVLNTLIQQFNEPVGIELLDMRESGNLSLYRQMDRERRKRRFVSVGIWAFGLICGGLVSWLIQSALT